MIIYCGKKEVGDEIIENKTYLVDFEDASPSQIRDEISRAKLSEFILWHEGNKIGDLKITNYIGNIYFFGKTINVKSNKFLKEDTGYTQFKTILDEIVFFSKNIIYSHSSPSFVVRNKDQEDNEPNNLLVFNYLKNLILNENLRIKLESNIRDIIKYSSFKYTYIYKKENLERCKNIDEKSFNLITSKMSDYVLIDDNSDHIFNFPIANFLPKKDGRMFYPNKIWNKTYELSYDTPENRFIKYFFEFVYSKVHLLFVSKVLPESLENEVDEIIRFCRKILNKGFFRSIGVMKILPTQSKTLLNKQGYKDIFAHYRNCRLGIQYLIQEFEINSMSINLKKISDLYEYWVFINIAKAFLGEDLFMEQTAKLSHDNNISYSTCLKNDTISIYYNLTESKSRNTSYSLTFRPDVTVVYNINGQKVKIIFDAKYRIDKIIVDSGSAKNEDIYKMHAYVDAIKDAHVALVVYPGTEFVFYEKEDTSTTKSEIEDIEMFRGVGAIPLTPGDKEQYKQLEELVAKLNKYVETTY
ncbi:5-methylcytosine restriction system specificity protein McrC [Bacteroides propionicifaciens]|uniref:5-methylcytosine restriction system specificity protein McrC n=2 Tax=Bacteroides propionicifaciens TaxID=392838 RepID=UPI0003796001|nr:DUF2357 domain-containing protein [Bacteroides propionicifaciens]